MTDKIKVTDKWLIWAWVRRNQKLKLKNMPVLRKFIDAVDISTRRHDVSYFFADNERGRFFKDVLVCRGGSPNYNLCKLTHNGLYIHTNPRLNLWHNVDIDHTILDRFQKMNNNRYIQPDTCIDIPNEYHLFLMQMITTVFEDKHNPDDSTFLTALNYATNTKTYTIFKGHPTTNVSSELVWQTAQQSGLTSKYTIFVNDCNVDYLVKHATVIYSQNSAVSLPAMLIGKPVATFGDTDMSEILPVITNPIELLDIRPVAIKELARFLTWYYHRLIIDVEKDDFADHIEDLVVQFKNKKSFTEMFQ